MLRNPETWVLIPFLVFVVLVARRIWRAIAAALDARAAVVRAEIEEAQRLREEAESMLAQARAERDEALAESKRVLERAHAEAARVAEATLAEAEASAKRRERMALDRIAAAERAALTDMRRLATDIATAAAERVLASDVDASADAALVERAISELPRALRAA